MNHWVKIVLKSKNVNQYLASSPYLTVGGTYPQLPTHPKKNFPCLSIAQKFRFFVLVWCAGVSERLGGPQGPHRAPKGPQGPQMSHRRNAPKIFPQIQFSANGLQTLRNIHTQHQKPPQDRTMPFRAESSHLF